MNANSNTIGFIGAGNMAQAIIRGLLEAGHPAKQIAVANPSNDKLEILRALNTDIYTTQSNTDVAEKSDVVVLATKPQRIAQVAAEIAGARPQLVMSVAAGITLATIEAELAAGTAVVRNMPNQPATVGLGMSGLVANSATDDTAKLVASYIGEASGEVVWLEKESLIDAITAISGSGPAYFYLLLEILEAGAVEFGFSPAVARKLALQTGLGATTLAREDGGELVELRRRVTSPGGTTEAAIKSLEAHDIRATFQRAFTAARDRATELGKK
ncbi:MAG: pyrroline-5-carboxylate reductase [Gammaproteobacteria bacterium]